MSLVADTVSLARTVRASALPGDTAALLSLGVSYARGRRGSPPRQLHPRSLEGAPVLVRPGTRDLVTYHDVFVRGYHATRHHGADVRTILDLGANIGLVSRCFARAFPRADIVAVEMDADNFSLLHENVGMLGSRIRLVRAAVWTHADGVSYSLDSSEDAFAVGESGQSSGGQATVPSVTPDQLVAMFDARAVDLVKMDVEGAEVPLLLESDVSWLAQVRCLQVEVHDAGLVAPIAAVLENAGFQVEAGQVHWSSLEAWR